MYPTHYNNVSPRLGVAWDVFGTGKTVVRSGFGMIYIQPSIRTFMFGGGGLNLNPSGLPKVLPDGTTVPGTGNLTTFLVSGADPSLITWNEAGPIFPVSGTSSNSCSTEVPCTVFAVDPKLDTPYVLNWNLNIQHQITPSMMLQVAYVGNRGVKLYSIVDQNQPNPAIATDPATGCYSSFSDNTPCYQPARPFSTNCPVSLGGLGTGGPCFPYLGFVNTLGNQWIHRRRASTGGCAWRSTSSTFTRITSPSLSLSLTRYHAVVGDIRGSAPGRHGRGGW